MATALRDLDPSWRAWLGRWADQFDPDLPVVFYDDDGTDAPDEWFEGPHLAVTCDWKDTPDSGPRSLVWPVGVPGWEDPKVTGWSGVAEHLPNPEA